jgi:hypothetical protein
MKRLIFSSFFILSAFTCLAQQKELPVTIKVPDSCRLILHAYAKGVQVYVCTQDAKDTTHYKWTFLEPRADLYSSGDYQQHIGKHYLSAAKSPTWEIADGSTVSGAKLQQAASPDSLSIPWLLLKAVATGGKGKLNKIVFIQRVNTHGGVATGKAGSTQKGKLLEVPYTAEYLFYSGE